jgi:predicted nucleotidyltransferase
MSKYNLHKDMILQVAKALGPELCKEVAFVGGSTTGLLLTDQLAKEQVRYTDDVDLIVSVMGYPGWILLQEKLRDHGFKESMENTVICRMQLGELQVDFMPDDDTLGFSNQWYRQALATADEYEISDGVMIRLVSPEFFVATKLEAYKGRGNNDPLESRDIEDLLNIIDGRDALLEEIDQASGEIKDFIALEFTSLLGNGLFEYAVQNKTNGNAGREEILFSRIEAIASGSFSV